VVALIAITMLTDVGAARHRRHRAQAGAAAVGDLRRGIGRTVIQLSASSSAIPASDPP
jgi:hypothetical protein